MGLQAAREQAGTTKDVKSRPRVTRLCDTDRALHQATSRHVRTPHCMRRWDTGRKSGTLLMTSGVETNAYVDQSGWRSGVRQV